MPKVMTVPIDRIRPNPFQPRGQFDPQAMEELAQSIREHGVIQPVVLLRDGRQYTLVAGERRWRAAQIAGQKTIPAIVHDCLSEEQMATWAMLENVCREALDPISEARGYQVLIQQFGMDAAEIATKTGRHPATIKSMLLLLDLDPEIQDLVARGVLPRDARVAKAFLSIPNRAARVRLAQRLGQYERVTVKTIVTACERLVEQISEPQRVTSRRQALNRAQAAEGCDAPGESIVPWVEIRQAAANVCQQCDIWESTLRLTREPAWSIIAHESEAVCGECSVRDIAAACGGCPQVDLLRRLIRVATKTNEQLAT